MRNLVIILKFCGTAYHGWQSQENAITVQDTLENAIFKLTNEKLKTTGCGRTDSGVHAEKFVVNFKTESNISCESFPYALNSFLPEDIVCTNCYEETMDFDARLSCKSKTYTYYILNSKYKNPFYVDRAWHYRYDIDIDKMKKASEAFLGTHDFIGFAASGFTVKTTVRTIYSLTVEKKDDLIKLEVTGNGFLYNMVRIIAGTLVFAGNGKIDYREMKNIIDSKDRKKAGITAPCSGLYLTEVLY